MIYHMSFQEVTRKYAEYHHKTDSIDATKTWVKLKIVNKVSQRSLRTNERSIWYGEDLYVSDVTAIYLSL